MNLGDDPFTPRFPTRNPRCRPWEDQVGRAPSSLGFKPFLKQDGKGEQTKTMALLSARPQAKPTSDPVTLGKLLSRPRGGGAWGTPYMLALPPLRGDQAGRRVDCAPVSLFLEKMRPQFFKKGSGPECLGGCPRTQALPAPVQASADAPVDSYLYLWGQGTQPPASTLGTWLSLLLVSLGTPSCRHQHLPPHAPQTQQQRWQFSGMSLGLE